MKKTASISSLEICKGGDPINAVNLHTKTKTACGAITNGSRPNLFT